MSKFYAHKYVTDIYYLELTTIGNPTNCVGSFLSKYRGSPCVK